MKTHYLDAHHTFFIESFVALLSFLALTKQVSLSIQLIISWDAFAITGIILSWMTFFRKDPYEARRRTLLNDQTRKFLFGIVLLAAVASFLATWLLLTSAKGNALSQVTPKVTVGIITVALSWFFVHTRFATQYAYLYYAEAPKKERSEISAGLLFPGSKAPDYFDFAYFSFVIGMTCQVSDVQIAHHHLRRLTLLHGLISFCFNTSILALIVNIVAGLA